eukprot:scaffold181708_cov41-Prasinocladus_malaysianus.AAC.1
MITWGCTKLQHVIAWLRVQGMHCCPGRGIDAVHLSAFVRGRAGDAHIVWDGIKARQPGDL